MIRVNNQTIDAFTFNGGECHISIEHIDIHQNTDVYAHLKDATDILRLMMTIDAIRRANFTTQIDLTIPYVPYARQDRVCNKGEALSIKVMSDMINMLNCRTVTIHDPHSDVTPALINNCITVEQAELLTHEQIKKVIREHNLTLIAPDAGAEKKTRKAAQQLQVNALFCSKNRDVRTGDIIGNTIPTDVTAQNYLIIDDICDGGRTFTELAKSLKNAGAKDLYLYVTHGVFSSGLETLKPHFKHVFCHHSFLDCDAHDPNFLTILSKA